MAVFVLDRRGKPLMPCTERRARLLLSRGRARIHRVVPFVIRLTDRLVEDCILQPLAVKIEPGNRVTGLAVVRVGHNNTDVLNLFELVHRGREISELLTARRNYRRRRRGANLRYRAPRFHHLRRSIRRLWLAPSQRHRVETIFNWVRRFLRWSPVAGLASELARDAVPDASLEESLSEMAVEGLLMESAAQLLFIRERLHDAALVDGTRWVLADRLLEARLPLILSDGECTHRNRDRLGIPRSRAHDAACVGTVGEISGWNRPVLLVKCTGRGSYQRTRVTAHGFPRGYLTRSKEVKGFRTGDRVRADVPSGKNAGVHNGRVAVRASGSFNIQATGHVVQGVSHRYCTLIQQADGYSYSLLPKVPAAQEH